MNLSELTHEEIEYAISAYTASLAATVGALNRAPVRTRNATSFLASMGADLEKSIQRNRLPAKSAGLVRALHEIVLSLASS